MPVYLFTGFLESGKTKFIQETLEDKRFCNKEKTLLLVCEEGEEEYAPEQFATDTVVIRVLEGQEQLTTENLTKWAQETKADRVVIEYNGMWLLDALYAAMPEGWVVYQEFMFADAGTFLSYNGNMRQLVYDKLKSCELESLLTRLEALTGMTQGEAQDAARAAAEEVRAIIARG